MIEPHRVQLRRTKGWKLPPNTVTVARPTKWGNPWKVEVEEKLVQKMGRADAKHTAHYVAAGNFRLLILGDVRKEFRDEALAKLKYPPLEDIKAELAGKNLACWCAPDLPCHADVLLEFANREEK